jgi:hypothetical protein
MEEPRDDKPSTIVEIAAGGDVILVVGPEEVKLRVHSLFLKTASKPFSAMFGPDWKEGHNMLGRDGPVELLLPEDNAAALKHICAIIHHQNNEVPQTLAAGDVLEVAITADKYDCVETLKFASGNWLRPGKNEAGDLMFLTAAAYLFRNAQAFKEITRALVLNHDGPYLAFLCEEVESAITWKVFCTYLPDQFGHVTDKPIQRPARRTKKLARLKLAEILLAGINNGTGMCVHKCGWTSKYAYAYLKLLDGKDLWPARLLHISISKAIELAENMPGPIPEEQSVACTYGYKHAAPEYRRDRCRSLDNLNNSIGLCLHCVRLGSMNSCNDGSRRA